MDHNLTYSTAEKKHILRNTNIFGTATDAILAQVANALEIVSVKAGEVIFEKNDSGTSMYIIIDGQIRVHDEELIFRLAGNGEAFGEMAALSPAVRSATITAEVDTILFRLEQKSLYDVMKNHFDVAKSLIHMLCQHLRVSSQSWADDFQRRVALEHEMEIGRDIQASFLPDKLLREPGWEFAAYFKAAREVSGDFYDAFTLPRNKVGLVIGDVCDKGVGPALFMAMSRTLLRAFASQQRSLDWMESNFLSDDHPADTVKRETRQQQMSRTMSVSALRAVELTNDYINENHSNMAMFATLFFGVLDPSDGQLAYINGGHDAPIIISPDGAVKALLMPTGPAVGMPFGGEFNVKLATLEPGDLLLAYSDGVTDAQSSTGERFTPKRLISLLEQAMPISSAVELLAHIEKAVQSHIDTTDQYDDITMLATWRKPETT